MKSPRKRPYRRASRLKRRKRRPPTCPPHTHLGKKEAINCPAMEESPPPSAPPMEMQNTTNTNNAPPCPCVTTACLGPYPSAREPLKAGLDSDDDDDSDEDDSSIDSSTSSQDDHDGSEADDEFFFGDVDGFMSETENMFQKMRERFPAHHMMSGSSSPKVASGGIGGINNSAHRRTSCPSLADTTATSTDASAMDTSGDDCVPATIRGFHSYSTGALSRCHSSTLSLHSGGGKSASSSKKKTRRRVSINSDVEVKPIPERSEYSPEVRSKMWTAGAELMQNAARNTIEFHAEGWNWRSVTEDEDMLRHTITRELIHPVHLHAAMELAKQQEEAANNNNNAGTTQQNPADFMARLPLERNNCSASMIPTPSPPKINIPSIAATAAAHAAVATVHPPTGPLSPPAATA